MGFCFLWICPMTLFVQQFARTSTHARALIRHIAPPMRSSRLWALRCFVLIVGCMPASFPRPPISSVHGDPGMFSRTTSAPTPEGCAAGSTDDSPEKHQKQVSTFHADMASGDLPLCRCPPQGNRASCYHGFTDFALQSAPQQSVLREICHASRAR